MVAIIATTALAQRIGVAAPLRAAGTQGSRELEHALDLFDAEQIVVEMRTGG